MSGQYMALCIVHYALWHYCTPTNCWFVCHTFDALDWEPTHEILHNKSLRAYTLLNAPCSRYFGLSTNCNHLQPIDSAAVWHHIPYSV